MSDLIYQQIPKVMADIQAIAKNRDNKAQGFKFRGIDDIYNEMHGHLVTHKLFTVTEVLEERREERQTKSGGAMTYVILKTKFTLFAEDGSSVSSVVIGEGADTGDKASNKAMSVAHKYFFVQTFSIPTIDDKDPDGHSPDFKPKTQPTAATRPATQPTSRPAPIQPATRPAPQQSSAGAYVDPRDYVIRAGRKEWPRHTIREVVDGSEKFGPGVGWPQFKKDVDFFALDPKSQMKTWKGIIELKQKADEIAREIQGNHDDAAEAILDRLSQDDFDFDRVPGGEK